MLFLSPRLVAISVLIMLGMKMFLRVDATLEPEIVDNTIALFIGILRPVVSKPEVEVQPAEKIDGPSSTIRVGGLIFQKLSGVFIYLIIYFLYLAEDGICTGLLTGFEIFQQRHYPAIVGLRG